MKRNRFEIFESAPPIEEWPEIASEELDPEDRELLRMRIAAVTQYCAGNSIREIETATGVNPSTIRYFAKRCTTFAPDHQIWGFRALVPYVHLADYEREAPIAKKFPEARGGMAGALGQVLKRFPTILKDLENEILKKKKKVNEFQLNQKSFKSIFLGLLEAKGVTNQEWPFNTKHQGGRTIADLMLEFKMSNPKLLIRPGNKAAVAHLHVGSGIPPLLLFREPFVAVEIDAHHIDAHFTVAFETPEGFETDVVIERIWLIAVVERSSTAVLSYKIVYSSEVSSADVVDAIRTAVNQAWKPREIKIPGVVYPPGGGLPSGAIPELSGAIWAVTMFDNALAHLAKVVHAIARQKCGFSINWGGPGHFERRPNVERLFRQIKDGLFARLPSTTGGSPTSGRATDGEEKARKHRIRAKDMEDLVDVFMAIHNSTPCEGISFLSPLEYLRQWVQTADGHTLVRKIPQSGTAFSDPFPQRLQLTVRGNSEDGRKPYVQLDRARYGNPVLSTSPKLVGQKLTVEVHDQDYRYLTAFLPNGSKLGVLEVQGHWTLSKHSRKTRKAINSLLSKRALSISQTEDPIPAYMNFLSRPDKKSARKHPKRKEALEATRVANESGHALTLANSKTPVVATASETPPTVSKSSEAVSLRLRSLMPQGMPDLDKIINRGSK